MRKHLSSMFVVIAVGGLVALAYAQHGSGSRDHSRSQNPMPASGQTYQADAIHSAVVFRIKHAGVGYTYGRFNDISGTIEVSPDSGHVHGADITIAADSLDTGNDKRDQHLKSPDFFNVKQFPEISFRSTRVQATGHRYVMTGKVSLHGRTKNITLPVEFVGAGKGPQGKQRAGVHAMFSIQRSDFGMTWGIDKGIVGDTVHLMVAVEGVRK